MPFPPAGQLCSRAIAPKSPCVFHGALRRHYVILTSEAGTLALALQVPVRISTADRQVGSEDREFSLLHLHPGHSDLS